MFDGRIYRAALVPLLLVIVIAGFSLVSRSARFGSTLAPDAFNGARAYADLQALVKRFPDRRPGSSGDHALASYIARSLRGIGQPLWRERQVGKPVKALQPEAFRSLPVVSGCARSKASAPSRP